MGVEKEDQALQEEDEEQRERVCMKLCEREMERGYFFPSLSLEAPYFLHPIPNHPHPHPDPSGSWLGMKYRKLMVVVVLLVMKEWGEEGSSRDAGRL